MTIDALRALRAQRPAPIAQCRSVLEEAAGDLADALRIFDERLAQQVARRMQVSQDEAVTALVGVGWDVERAREVLERRVRATGDELATQTLQDAHLWMDRPGVWPPRSILRELAVLDAALDGAALESTLADYVSRHAAEIG